MAWDYTPPVCPFPASVSCASAALANEEAVGGAAAVDQGPALPNAPAGEQEFSLWEEEMFFGLLGTLGVEIEPNL